VAHRAVFTLGQNATHRRSFIDSEFEKDCSEEHGNQHTAAIESATIRIAEFTENPCEIATATYRSAEPLKEGWGVNHIWTKVAEPAMPLNPWAVLN
jgi:hypothetical protein